MEYLWIVGLVLILAAVAVIAIRERKNLKSWLVFAVAAAEKALGSGTGELKLRQVYDQFLDKFPVLSKFMSFEMFSGLVDKALESLDDMLNTNEAVNAYIKGE